MFGGLLLECVCMFFCCYFVVFCFSPPPLHPQPSRYTLSSSNIAVAALLCALFPVFPSDSLDNRYHLQALRHLYVLASRPGVLLTRNRETGEPCPVKVSIKAKGDEVVTTTTPCLLPDWEKIERVEVVDEEYWPLTVASVPDKDTPLR